MTTININGQRVRISDEFRSMLPEQQNQIVRGIIQQLGIQPSQEAPQPPRDTWQAARDGTMPDISGPQAQRQALIDDRAEADMTRARQERIVQDNPAGARMAVMAQGLPFVGEYVDEGMGAIMGPQARDTVREWQGAMDATRPGQATGLRVAGGVLGSLPLAGPVASAGIVSPTAGLGMNAARAGAAGAAIGGVEGAVSGYGAENDGDRMQSALDRGTMGGAVGGVVGGALPVIGAGVRNVLQRFRTSDLQTIAREFGISDDAARVVRRALEAEDFAGAQQAIERAGGRAMLADAGEASRTLLDASIASGGQSARIGREAVNARAQQGGQEFNRVLDRFFGKPQGVQTTQQGIRSGTQAARGSAYRDAYSSAIDYSSRAGQRLEGLTGRIPSSAIQRANRLMQTEGAQSRQIMAQIADDGTVTFQRMPDVRQWDYITRALGDLADSGQARGAMGGATSESRAITNLQRDIRNTLRSHVPAYDKALREAADAIGQVRATEVGASLLQRNMTREQARASLRGMGQAERAAARQGLRSQIDDMMAQTQRALTDGDMDAREAIRAWRALSSRQSQDNISALLGRDRARALSREIDRIGTDFELRAAVAMNSKTAVRQAVQGEVQQVTRPGVLDTLMEGRPVDAGKRLVQAMSGKTEAAQAARQAGIFSEITEALTRTRGADEARRIMRVVGDSVGSEPISQARAAHIARQVTAALGGGTHQSGIQWLQSQ